MTVSENIQRISWRECVYAMLRMFFAFVLAFSSTWAIECALVDRAIADEATETTSENIGENTGEGTGEGGADTGEGGTTGEQGGETPGGGEGTGEGGGETPNPPAPNIYTVDWYNEDGTQLQTGTCQEGEVPIYSGADPVKADDEENTYTFVGWSPEVGPATGNIAYTAVFSAVPKKPTTRVTDLEIFEKSDLSGYTEHDIKGMSSFATNYARYGAAEGGEYFVNRQLIKTITARGDAIEFGHISHWDDNSQASSTRVEWQIVEPADQAKADRIARFDGPTSGVLRAQGIEDGTLIVSATLDGSLDTQPTADGQPLVAYFQVEVMGQTDTPYITSIEICDEQGNVIDPSYTFDKNTVPLSAAVLNLQARVTVHDPATDSDAVYQCTPTNGLSAQTGGRVSDLTWASQEPNIGVMSEEGIYRALVSGSNTVTCSSLTGGFSGRPISTNTSIVYPTSGRTDGWNPQDTLTVRVVYETAPDTEVASKTFSIEDLEDLGMHTHTYTAIGSAAGYFTTTGEGPYFSDVLEAAGVNLDGIKEFTFQAYPNIPVALSYHWLYDNARYYFPNYNVASIRYVGAERVIPMVAINSARAEQTAPCDPNYNLNTNRRFMLLFGSQTNGEEVSRYQIYCIAAITVVLAGAPPVQDGTDDPKDPEPKDEDNNTNNNNNSGNNNNAGNDNNNNNAGDNTGNNNAGNNNAGNNNTNNNGGANTANNGARPENGSGSDATTPQNGNNASQRTSNDDKTSTGAELTGGFSPRGTVTQPSNPSVTPQASEQGTPESAESQTQEIATTQVFQSAAAVPDEIKQFNYGRWSMLQAINKHPSDVDDLMLNNPWAPFAGPTAAGVFAAGGSERLVRYIRQKRKPQFVED